MINEKENNELIAIFVTSIGTAEQNLKKDRFQFPFIIHHSVFDIRYSKRANSQIRNSLAECSILVLPGAN